MVSSNLKIGEWTYEATGLGKKNRNKQAKFPQHKKNTQNPKTNTSTTTTETYPVVHWDTK